MQSNKMAAFELYRALAVLMVVLGHFSSSSEDLPTTVKTIITSIAHFGVPLFFIISGFLITLSYVKKENIRIFLRHRIIRIYPAFSINLLFITLIIGPLVSVNIHDFFDNINYFKLLRSFINLYIANDALNIFQNIPWPNAVNGSLWTLQFEIMCYGMIGFLGLFGFLKPRIILFLFVVFYCFYIAIEYFGYQGFHIILNGMFNSTPRLFVYFLIGSIFYFYNDKLFFNWITIMLSLILLIVTNELLILKSYLVFFWAYIGFYFIFNKKIKLHNFSKYGDFSYGMYIYAFPIQQAIMYLFRDYNIDFVIFTFLSFVITLILSILSWKLIESPTLTKYK